MNNFGRLIEKNKHTDTSIYLVLTKTRVIVFKNGKKIAQMPIGAYDGTYRVETHKEYKNLKKSMDKFEGW